MKPQTCVISKPEQMQSVGAAIREVIRDFGKCAIKFGPQQFTRSQAQNRLLWKWHGELAKHILDTQGGTFSTDDIHEYVVSKLLPKRVIDGLGEPIIVRAETKKLNTKEMTEFLNHYDGWALTTYACKFTHPDDLYWQAMGEEK
uniref:recombination protein NinB n=1 Tax=Ningiella ruwaisensis TaxID=2364274 RepID=UPI0010A01A23|nr:recombination protein NinB [Ningiella ruwaisensis]